LQQPVEEVYTPVDNTLDLADPDLATQNESPEENATPPKPRPARRRGRPKKNVEAKREAYERGLESMELEYDEWVQKWDWEAPRMHCKVKRTSPLHHQGHQVAGTCGEIKANAFYTEDEIRERFGGGTFTVYVSGVDSRDGKFRALGNKKLQISGSPRTDVPPTEIAAKGVPAASQQGGGSGVNDLAPQAQAGLVTMLDKNFERLAQQNKQLPVSSADPELMKEVYEGQVRTVKEAASKEAEALRAQLDELRQETSQLRIERDTLSSKADTEVAAARADGERYVSTMIPTFAAQADQRAQHAAEVASQQVKTIQEQYARDLQMAQQMMQQQMQNQQTLFQAAETNAQTLFQGQIAHMRTINATLQAKVESLEAECRTMRDQVTNMHAEAARKQDPLAKLTEMQTMQEVVQSMAGGSGGDLGDDASPALRLLSQALPAATAVAEAVKAKIAGPTQSMQQMAQQQMPQPTVFQPSPVQVPTHLQTQAPTQSSSALVPRKPHKRVRKQVPAQVRRQDLEVGIAMLNTALVAKAPPEKAADTAATQIDQKTLKALVQHPPAAIIQSLQSADLLTGSIASDVGLQYLGAFLVALKSRLYPTPQQSASTPTSSDETPEG